jgi:hypothetical protein
VRRIALPALLIAALAPGCSGCTDGGNTHAGGRSDEQPPSKADYIELADAICRNHQSRREDLESQAAALGSLNSAAKARRVAGLLRRESRNLRSEIRELEARRPPSPNSALDSFSSAIRARAEALDEWARAYDDLDEGRIRKLQVRVGLLAATAERRARRYGFRACGR